MIKQDTKTWDVLQHLKEHGSITQLEATELYGATRLSAIVFNLRKKGYAISSETQGAIDRHGHAVNYARYILNQGHESLEEYYADKEEK